tara:strand:+ start:2535 stop:4661 length:2127 start_codon:yes stop_codon:yes gene_type:complete
MIQLFVKEGKVVSTDVPIPEIEKGSVLIKVLYSCISTGTEVSTLEDSKISIVKKIIEKPDRIVSGIKMLSEFGLKKSIKEVRDIKLHSTPIGYSISGIVIAVGSDVSEFEIGDKVAAAGAGMANHAEYVNVPKNLVVRCPNTINMKEASTITLGAISLHGVRRCNLSIGDFCVVFGVGILGLLSVQLLKNAGVRVIAVDIDDRRLEIARNSGAELIINSNNKNPIEIVKSYTNHYGADAVLFAANVSNSDPLSQAFKMCRRKGKVVMLGKAKLEINRSDMYPNEIDLITSTSYGPGRYDNSYELDGIDYPYHYVRWTEKRNLAEFIRLIDKKLIDLNYLIEKTYKIDEAEKAFNYIQKSDSKPLLVILKYKEFDKIELSNDLEKNKKIIINDKRNKKLINVAIIGASPFAKNVHIPNFKKLSDKFFLKALMTRTGINAVETGIENQFSYCTSSYDKILKDEDVDLVFITLNQGNHAKYVLKALEKGKNVFVEKPLATNREDLDDIIKFYKNNSGPLLMVGFNRRFSKYLKEIKSKTKNRTSPLFINYRMNAGFKNVDSLIFKEGGRIIGEGCHIIDLFSYLVDSKIKSISYESISKNKSKFLKNDNKSIVLKYHDGSLCTLQYLSMGNNDIGKEFMEVHFDNKTILLHDYKSIEGFGVNIEKLNSKVSDKGHLDELIILHDYLNGKTEKWPINYDSMIETTLATFLIT